MRNKMTTVSMAIVGLLVLSLHGLSSSAFAETNISLAENTKPPLQIVNQTELKVAVQVIGIGGSHF